MISKKYQDHELRVQQLQEQLRGFYDQGKKVKIYHGSTNSTRPQQFVFEQTLDVSQLNQVIEVNAKQLYVLVEPNVHMDELVDATLAHGLVPPIVTEFPGITVGGAIMGGAFESSSFKYGCVSEICIEYEVILGSGKRVSLSAEMDKELFHGIACSYGSLGVLTLIKLSLIPAKPYVHLDYQRVDSFKSAVKLISDKSKSKVNFIDAIMFSNSYGVVMTGSFSDKKGLPVATFHKTSDEWFYIHAKAVLNNQSSYEELIPVRDYLFRYDRGAFWTGKFGFSVTHLPFWRLLRIVFAVLFKTRVLFKFLHASKLSQQLLVQDACLPRKNATKFLDFVDKNYAIYPLWICPLKPQANDFLSPTYLETDLVINVGVYGELGESSSDFEAKNRLLEDHVQMFNGRKVLYAHSYYSQPTFWRIYDLAYYTKLRNKYSAHTIFPDVFHKIKSSRQPLKPSMVKGWLSLLSNTKIK